VSTEDVSLPIGEVDFNVKGFFLTAAEAVVSAQKSFDGEAGLDYLRYCAVDSHRMLFSVPRTAVTVRFGVEETFASTWRLVPWKRTRQAEQKQKQTHALEFSIDAVPNQPQKGPVGAATPVDLYIARPYFMLSAEKEQEIGQRLISALTPETRSWSSSIPPSKRTPEELKNMIEGPERQKVSEALKAINDPDERGLIIFRLESTPPSFLVVRAVGKDANDSVFVVTPDALTEVVVYSVDDDKSKSIRFAPLFNLMRTIRRCQEGTLTPLRQKLGASEIGTGSNHPLAADANNGLAPLLPFAEQIRSGYAETIAYLEDPQNECFMQAGGAQLTPSLYYEITNVKASLTYSLGYEHEGDDARTRFDFQLRSDPKQVSIDVGDQTGETKLIESRAVIRASRPVGQLPQVEVELETPEFVLSSAARARLIELAVNSVGDIETAFGSGGVSYRDSIKNESLQRKVVAFLSYRGKEPKEEFLIVWAGSYGTQARDFAFTCAADQNDRSRLTNIKVVMRLKDDLSGIEFSNVDVDQGEASGEQYRAFHNFFHAVRIWRARMIV
jgi:hypothetical protein